MAHKAIDGSEWTAPTMAKMQNNRIKARGESKDMTADSGQSPEGIENDPEAMSHVDALKKSGYSAEDVHRAMGGDEEQKSEMPMQASGHEATQAASLNIPGLR